jgi:hypothetical protein
MIFVPPQSCDAAASDLLIAECSTRAIGVIDDFALLRHFELSKKSAIT